MPRRTTLVAAAVLAAAALALTACSGGSTPSSSSKPGPIDPNATVDVRLALEPGNLDIRQTAGAALDQILVDNVYQGLVSRTPDQKIVPALASAWTVSPDGLTYTFTLREGVTFGDGQALTPLDVVWSLQTRKATPTWSDSARLANVSLVTAKGQEILLKLSKPDSSLLWNLTGRAGIILKKGDTVDYKTAANGTGPFVLTSWKQGDSITFERNDKYWGAKSKAQEIVWHYIPDNQAALNGALAGELDVLTGFDANFKQQVESNGDFTLELGSATDKFVLAMNQTSGPLADKRVRQAIRQAIDHKAIVKAVGSGIPLYGPIPKSDPGYEDLASVAPYDPAAAEKLLADAGEKNLTLTLTMPSFYGTTIPQLLVSDFRKVGITLKVDSVDFPTWLQDVYTNKDYELSLVDHAEARDFENWANPEYYFTYDNPQVQDLYAQSLAATTDSEASGLLKQAARIVSEDMAADWLYNWNSVVAVGTDVSGMPIDNVNARINAVELAKSKG